MDVSRQGLMRASILRFCGTAGESAETCRNAGEVQGAIRAGAKAHTLCATLSARLKPCPGYKALWIEFFSRPGSRAWLQSAASKPAQRRSA
jgi:hypothetical protein